MASQFFCAYAQELIRFAYGVYIDAARVDVYGEALVLSEFLSFGFRFHVFLHFLQLHRLTGFVVHQRDVFRLGLAKIGDLQTEHRLVALNLDSGNDEFALFRFEQAIVRVEEHVVFRLVHRRRVDGFARIRIERLVRS